MICINPSSRRQVTRFNHFGWIFSASAALCGLWAAIPSAQAQPLRFNFEATISEIEGDTSALNLPFSLAVGDRIVGAYAFQNGQDLLDIFFRHELGKQGQVTLIIDETEIEAGANFGSVNDVGAPPDGSQSSLFLGYVSPTDIFPGWGGYVDGHPWDAALTLVGAEGTISTPDDVLDISNWNELTTLRRLDLQFGYPNTVIVRTIVAGFNSIPEPSSAFMLWSALSIGALSRLSSNRQR